MYPEIVVQGIIYDIDYIIPLLAIVGFVMIVYYLTKSQGLQFRMIASKLPLIIITTILLGTYSHFILQSGSLIPINQQQIQSLFAVSLDSLDFVGVAIGCFVAHIITIFSLSSKSRSKRNYVLLMSYLILLVMLGVGYSMGDSVIGKFNDGFYSIGTFSDQSRIAQLGGSVYPIGLAISLWSAICSGILLIMYRRFPNRGSYFVGAIFLLGYIAILPYQAYSRHLVSSFRGLQLDLRSYVSFAIACICIGFGYSVPSVHRFSNRAKGR